MIKSLKILRFALPYWGSALFNIFFNVLSALFSLVSFALFIPVLEILFDRTRRMVPGIDYHPDWHAIHSVAELKSWFYGSISSIIETYGEMRALWYIALVIVTLFLLKNLFRYLAMFFLARVRNGVVMDLRNALYYKSLILPLSFYSGQRKGDLMARLGGDVQEVEWSVMSSMEMIFRDPITIISYLVTLFIIHPLLTGFVLVLLPISGLLIAQIGKSLKRTSRKSQEKMGYLMSLVEESIAGLRIIKAFNAIETSRRNFEKENRRYTRLMIRLYRKRDLASPLSEFLGVLVVVVILLFGGRLVLDPYGSLKPEVFLVYLGIFSQLIPPAKSIVQAFYNIQKGTASIERINEILNAEEVITEKPQALEKHTFDHSIEYRGVWFNYGQDDVLKDINLNIRCGQTLAIVGPSGSGKSTLVDLLPRFYDPTQGNILLDGHDLRDYRIDHLRGLMGIVSQDTILFNDSVFNNIALGMKDVTEEAVEKAARVANAYEFIMQLPEGFQTVIGDRGLKLSGGQRQRLSIARAVLKNPPILILDEATSSLDTESERLVQDALDHLMENRTVIVIAHRLSTIHRADEIIVMHQGSIVERGTHEYLYSLDGMYRKLFDMQTLNGMQS
ncbi:MAG: ABC transporter ATP-binding protein [Bacteroidales bacterium]